MKKIYIIVTFLALGMYVKSQEWGYVNTLTDEWMRAIWTQGLDTVYIVGENGLIARSTDQGETWKKQHFPTQTALNDIIFIDHYTGFVVGEQGAILKTSDAGETWKQLTFDLISQINAIAATGLDNIWAVGDNSLILHSTDTGETWEQVNILPENDKQLLDIDFRGNLGYFIGNYATVYKTEDFGANWDKQIINTDHSAHFYSLSVTNNMVYILEDNLAYIMTFSIKDDKVNWTKKEIPIHLDKSKLYFVNDSVGYFLGIYPIPTCGCTSPSFGIFRTTDRASNWVYVMAGDYNGPILDHSCFDVGFANDTIGYAILGTTIVKTPMLTSEPPVLPDLMEAITVNPLLTLYWEANDLIVSCLSHAIKFIDLLDIHGRSLQKQFMDGNHFLGKINISGIPNGVYLVKVNLSDNEVCIKKWIKR